MRVDEIRRLSQDVNGHKRHVAGLVGIVAAGSKNPREALPLLYEFGRESTRNRLGILAAATAATEHPDGIDTPRVFDCQRMFRGECCRASSAGSDRVCFPDS